LGFLLLNRRSPAAFTPDEMNWASRAAAQIAIALENALAFREIAALKDRTRTSTSKKKSAAPNISERSSAKAGR
jgi:GAF domain-containing protein